MRQALAALVALLPFSAMAQNQCAPVDQVIRFLGETHHEAPIAIMTTSRGRVFIFATKDGRTWTMVIEASDRFCVVMDGIDLRQIQWADPGRGS